jgi:hypothetical protein
MARLQRWRIETMNLIERSRISDQRAPALLRGERGGRFPLLEIQGGRSRAGGEPASAPANFPNRLPAKGCLVFFALFFGLAASALGEATPDGFVSYTNDVDPSVPWSIHVVKIDRAAKNVRLCTALGGGSGLGMGIVSEQVKTLPPDMGTPLAAINGDFYEKARAYPGRPRDLQIRNGEVLTQPDGHACFWIDTNGNPQMTNLISRFRVLWPDGKSTPFGMNSERTNGTVVLYTAILGSSTLTDGGVEYVLEQSPGNDWLPLRAGRVYTARVRRTNHRGNSVIEAHTAVLSVAPDLHGKLPALNPGDTLQLATESIPNLSGVDVAIGGGPALVQDGRLMSWKGWVHLPQPRTALGWNKRFIYLVEVDGRQLDLSLGMTFTQLAKYLRDLGCEQAMNLDGGGSATLWAFGSVKNSPSEGQERPAPNALVVVTSTPPTATAAK